MLKGKAVTGIMLELLLAGLLTMMLGFQTGEANPGTIYIREDGSIDPPTANINTYDHITYTFTGNISDSIIVERNNIVVDGAGYTLQAPERTMANGFSCSNINNVSIRNTNIGNFAQCVFLNGSSNISVSGNNILPFSFRGISLQNSSYNSISGNNIDRALGSGILLLFTCSYNSISRNNITSGGTGIDFCDSANNTVCGNKIRGNFKGIYLDSASNNMICHNNFIDNTEQIHFETGPYTTPSIDIWDDGYPSGGNYWSNYTGVDVDGDGIGDTPHIIDSNNQDNYPLMNPYIAGDLNYDGLVGVSDLTAFGETYGTMPCNSDWNVRADVNDDHIINAIDLATLGRNYGKTDP